MGNVNSDSKLQRKPLPPQKLTDKHNTEDFCCGVEVLDDWLKKRALRNETIDASRTYVVCLDNKVIGYYALAVGSVRRELGISQVRRNMPDPVPVMILARLAVDLNWRGKGIGFGLLRDAIMRTVQAADLAGIKAILVHALTEQAKEFYEKAGFRVSPVEPLTLMITVKEARSILKM